MRNIFNESMGSLVKKVDAMALDVGNTLSSVEVLKSDLGTVKAAVSKHDQQIVSLQKELSKSRKQNEAALAQSVESAKRVARECVASLPSPQPVPVVPSGSDSFDRPPRPHALQCNAEKNVLFAKTSVAEVIKGLMEKKGLECEFEIPGEEVARRFTIFFKGPGNVPNEVVLSLLRSRKGSDGKFLHIAIKDPHGAEHKFYFGPDKSPKAARVETVTKKFCAILQEEYAEKISPSTRFSARRDTGIISLDGTRLAFVGVTKDKSELSWNARALPDSGVDKEAMSKKFNVEFNVEWSP